MPDPNDDAFLKAAVRLGFLKEGEARKAVKEAVRSSQNPEQWLLGRGILTPREAERIKRTARPGRPPTRRGTRRGPPVEARSHAGLWFALLGFAVVLGGGLFLFKDRIFEGSSTRPEPVERRDVAAGPTAETASGELKPEPARAPDAAAESSTTPKTEAPPDPGNAGEAIRPPAGDPTAKRAPKGDDEPSTPPRPARRDPKLRKAGDAAFDRGEKLNEQVSQTKGEERAELMEKALGAYTEALVNYREYSGARVPAFLEKRYVEVNSRVAWLRKLMPLERVAKYIDRLTGREASASELLEQAEAAYSRSPLDDTLNYMMFQLVLDNHPDSKEAITALRRIGEIGWHEVKSLTTRGEFMDVVKKWKKAMRAGNYASVRRSLREVQTDTEMRRAMKKSEWEWFQTVERALRVPKAALENVFRGQVVEFRRRGGSLVKGEVRGTDESGIRFSDGRVVRVSRLHPEDLARLALGEEMNGSKYLTRACFLAFSGYGQKGHAAFEKAKKYGVPVEDYETPIQRLRYESKKNNR